MTAVEWSILCLLAAGATGFAGIRAWRSINVVLDRLDEMPDDRYFEAVGHSVPRNLSGDVVLLFRPADSSIVPRGESRLPADES